jgi:hypothetical protein
MARRQQQLNEEGGGRRVRGGDHSGALSGRRRGPHVSRTTGARRRVAGTLTRPPNGTERLPEKEAHRF